VSQEIKCPVVHKLLTLLQFRNDCAAFDLNGTIDLIYDNEAHFTIIRSNSQQSDIAKLMVNIWIIAV
jgi:hypothetical protein